MIRLDGLTKYELGAWFADFEIEKYEDNRKFWPGFILELLTAQSA
jgi:hypothetical protein